MQSGIPRARIRSAGRKPSPRSASVVGTCADGRARRGEEIELRPVGVRRVDDRRPLAETAGAGEKLDRTTAVLGEAFLDLLRLLVRVHVERKLLALRVAPDLLEPLGGARAHGVGGDRHAYVRRAELLDLGEVRRDRLLPEAGEPAARVGDVQEDELDACRRRGLHRRERLRQAEVVELADRRVARAAHLAIRRFVARPHELGRLPLGLGEHGLAPRPEVTAGRAPAQRPLERVAVGVHESRQLEATRPRRRRYQRDLIHGSTQRSGREAAPSGLARLGSARADSVRAR